MIFWIILFFNSYVKLEQLNLFIHHSNTRGGDKNTVFVVVMLSTSELKELSTIPFRAS